jgi:hypothetical protein
MSLRGVHLPQALNAVATSEDGLRLLRPRNTSGKTLLKIKKFSKINKSEIEHPISEIKK